MNRHCGLMLCVTINRKPCQSNVKSLTKLAEDLVITPIYDTTLFSSLQIASCPINDKELSNKFQIISKSQLETIT